MYVSKDGAARKKELLDAALMVFCEKGYESSSVQDIIDAVGVTRGAFYHYFNSKEEVMKLIAVKQAQNIIDICQEIADRAALNALDKLKQCFIALLEFRVENEDRWIQITEALYRYEENIRLRGIMDEKFKQELIPVFISIIEQGKKEELFETSFVEEVAEMIYVLGLHYTTVKFELFENRGREEAQEALKSRIEFLMYSLEKSLGLDSGLREVLDEIDTTIEEIGASVISYYLDEETRNQ